MVLSGNGHDPGMEGLHEIPETPWLKYPYNNFEADTYAAHLMTEIKELTKN